MYILMNIFLDNFHFLDIKVYYMSYYDNFMSFIAKAEDLNWTVTEVKHLENNVAPDHKIIYSKAALEAKFNRKFTENEVIKLLQELPVTEKVKDDVSIPQWYVDKWLTK